jgi:flagellar hook-length control protein FliK
VADSGLAAAGAGAGVAGTDQAGGADAQAPAAADGSTLAIDAAAGGDGASTSTNSGSGDRTSGAAAVLGPASASSASAAGGSAEGVRGNPITDQVFDQVTRLVSRGDGTHRITLRLHPADLGEVKVVLTVKNGTVDVTLSAGAAAREALREGSPQLRSLLELTGATTGQVVVRDLGSSAVSAAAQQQAAGSAPDQGQQQSQDNGDGLADAREDGFDGFADGGFDEEPDRPGDGADLLGGTRRERAGSARSDGHEPLPTSPSKANPASGGARTSLFIPSRLDLNL